MFLENRKDFLLFYTQDIIPLLSRIDKYLSPFSKPFTNSPIASILPATSCPEVDGNFTPQSSTFMNTPRGPVYPPSQR
jgi:hypothetical protein